MTLDKRKWCYLQPPKQYEFAPCTCGNEDTQWSEYQKHLWCDKCEKDFLPAHNGVFDGPIPMGAAQMLGMSFARIDLETKEIEDIDSDLEYVKCLNVAEVFTKGEIPFHVKYYKKSEGITAKFVKKEAVLYITNDGFNIELKEPITDAANEFMKATIKFLSAGIPSFDLLLKLGDDKSTLTLSKHKDFETFILVNKLDADLPQNNTITKTNKI